MKNRNSINDFFKRIFTFILLAGVLCAAFPLAAQTRRGVRTTKTSAAKPAPGERQRDLGQIMPCGGWSGIITYQKTLNYAWNSGKKDTNMGVHESKATDEYKYTGRIIVDGSLAPKVVGTQSQVLLNDTELKWVRVEKTQDCANDKVYKPQLQWWEDNDKDITNAFHEGEADNFNLSVNELAGTYSFSFRFPDARGTREVSHKRTQGGWCKEDWNKPETRFDKYEAIVSGEGKKIEDQKIDHMSPDVLSGSKTWTEGSLPSSTYTIKVTWSFKRCPAPVEVIDIRFDDHVYPDYKTWKETREGTVDGNIVRIRATVTNFSAETKFPTIKFNETVENWVLPDGEKSIRLEPGESRELELEWDTAGYAWQGKGYDAESERRIKVEAIDGTRTSQKTRAIHVKPRPVVLVHGLWSNAAAWNDYGKFFEQGHGITWRSFAVGADPSVAKMNTGETFGNTAQTYPLNRNVYELEKQIKYVHKTLNAWHVDIVAHSMGGLIARQYISQLMPLHPLTRRPFVTRLIMLGTPNAGSPCAKLMYTALAASGNKIWALWELIPDVVEKFNDTYHQRRGVRFSALVGWRVPYTCQSPSQGDGVVTVGSARFKIMDWRYSDSMLHTDLTSRADFGSFVFPRLSIGPRGNHDPELIVAGNENDDRRDPYTDSVQPAADRYGFNSMFRKASYQKAQNVRNIEDDEPVMGDVNIEGLRLAKQVRLASNQTTEIEIPMTNGSRASVVLMASPNVSATLIDSAGKIVGKSQAGTPDSKQMFRTIAVEKAITSGTWKLKLESKETTETSVLLAAFSDPNPLSFSITTGKPTPTKKVSLQAKLTNNNEPVSGAVVKAKIESATGQSVEIVLLDDGSHDDGAPGDGIYGATTEKLGDGDYLVEAKAETNGQIRLAAAAFTVGAETSPVAKPISKTGKK